MRKHFGDYKVKSRSKSQPRRYSHSGFLISSGESPSGSESADPNELHFRCRLFPADLPNDPFDYHILEDNFTVSSTSQRSKTPPVSRQSSSSVRHSKSNITQSKSLSTSPVLGLPGELPTKISKSGEMQTKSSRTSPVGDSSLRISTILKRWHLHRFRRHSATDADSTTAQVSPSDSPNSLSPTASSSFSFLSPKKKLNCFGKRSQGNGRRPNECLILEPSEMMVIDYPDVYPSTRGQVNPRLGRVNLTLDSHEMVVGAGGITCPMNPTTGLTSEPPPSIHYSPHNHVSALQIHHDGTHSRTSAHIAGIAGGLPHHIHHDILPHPQLPDLLRSGRSRGSVSSSVRDGSDTSSAYSGSDTMCQSIHSLEHEDVDLTGLVETIVDSDEEDIVENVEGLSVQDTVRECLEKDPSDRTEADIKILLEFTERLSAFSNMTVGVRRAMCQAMVFAVVEHADTILMNDCEELDSWSVIINGQVEVTKPDGAVKKLYLGDSFGITPTMEKLFHHGVMRSKVDDCQFVCIRQSDYYRILRQGEENMKRHEEGGKLVLVTEKSLIDSCHREANIVIKGTPERLMFHLLEVENILDTTYVEDFLLMHRKFIQPSVCVAQKLLEWFDDPKYEDIVTRVFLRWVQSYFTDFEMDPEMMSYLEAFEEGLQRKGMSGQLFFLRMVCMTKARARTVTLTRPSRDKPLQFTIVGRKNFGIFVSNVEKGSKAEEVGLKRADQILEVNGHNFSNVSRAEALETLTTSCHLEITVRSNLHTYNDMLQTPESAPKSRHRKISDISMGSNGNVQNGSCQTQLDFVSTLNLNVALTPQSILNKKEKPTSMTLKTTKFKDFIAGIMTRSSVIESNHSGGTGPGYSDDSVSISSQSSTGGHLFRSRSNPDLSNNSDYHDHIKSEFPEHVLKVYRATDNSTRFLPVHKETTAREVVMLSLSLFNIAEPSQNYALYEISVAEGSDSSSNHQSVVKQKRLPDSLQNLAERIGLNSRYYLKSVTSSQKSCPDDVISDLIKESQVSLLQLNSVVELAIQLTLEDFSVFRQIEPTEYVDNLFKLKSKYGTPALSKFEQRLYVKYRCAGIFLPVLRQMYSASERQDILCTLLCRLQERFIIKTLWWQISNKELYWVCSEICTEQNVHKRAKIIKQFIKIAKYCKDLNNFNSMFAILSGLGSPSVGRLRGTWSRVSNRYRKMFNDLETVMDPSQNMKNYRKLASSSFSQSPMIPFYPIVKKDLLFLHEGNEDEVDGLINFEKLRTISKSVRKLTEMCSSKYNPSNMLEKLGQPQSTAMMALNHAITAGPPNYQPNSTVKRRKKSTVHPDKKKMYEEAQTIRRIKAYLKNLRVIKDEEKLIKLSYECEPPSNNAFVSSSSGAGTSTNPDKAIESSRITSSNSTRRKLHSPTPSTTSSASSHSYSSDGKKTHPRFGAASPTSERKLLSLAEVTKKPYHGPRHASTGTHSPNPSPSGTRKGSLGPTTMPPPAINISIGVLGLGGGVHPIVLNEDKVDHHKISSVHLNAESSSVTSLSNFNNIRKLHQSGSTDMGGSETDSGISTQYDAISSTSSLNCGDATLHPPSPPSPLSHRRRYSHQTGACIVRVPRRGAPGGSNNGPLPPDYNSTQLRIHHMGRARSHDAVSTHFYHRGNGTRRQDEEDEAQVSAV